MNAHIKHTDLSAATLLSQIGGDPADHDTQMADRAIASAVAFAKSEGMRWEAAVQYSHGVLKHTDEKARKSADALFSAYFQQAYRTVRGLSVTSTAPKVAMSNVRKLAKTADKHGIKRDAVAMAKALDARGNLRDSGEAPAKGSAGNTSGGKGATRARKLVLTEGMFDAMEFFINLADNGAAMLQLPPELAEQCAQHAAGLHELYAALDKHDVTNAEA